MLQTRPKEYPKIAIFELKWFNMGFRNLQILELPKLCYQQVSVASDFLGQKFAEKIE